MGSVKNNCGGPSLLISQSTWQHHKPLLEVVNYSFPVCVTFTASEMASLMTSTWCPEQGFCLLCLALLQMIKICIFLKDKIFLVAIMPFNSVFSRALVSPVEIVKNSCYMGESQLVG